MNSKTIPEKCLEENNRSNSLLCRNCCEIERCSLGNSQIVPKRERDFRNVFWLIVDFKINASEVFANKEIVPYVQRSLKKQRVAYATT